MRNYLILFTLLLSLSGCVGQIASVAGGMGYLAIHHGKKIFKKPIKCDQPKYNIVINTNDLDLRERFSLETSKTGCFSLSPSAPDFQIKPTRVKIKQNQILEVRLYKDKSIVDITTYQCNNLNLQEKIEESVQDILSTFKEQEHYAKVQ